MNRTRVTIDPASAPTLPLITLAARDAPLLRAPPLPLTNLAGRDACPQQTWRGVPCPCLTYASAPLDAYLNSDLWTALHKLYQSLQGAWNQKRGYLGNCIKLLGLAVALTRRSTLHSRHGKYPNRNVATQISWERRTTKLLTTPGAQQIVTCGKPTET